MIIQKLRDSVRSIPGVASAEVSLGPDEEPLVRVWTDGTRPDSEVQSAVEVAMAKNESNPDSNGDLDIVRDSETTPPEASPEPTPRPGNAAIDVTPPNGLIAKLGIEESLDCVEVRAVDYAGRSGTAIVGDGEDGLNKAIAAAVARLRGVDEPTRIQVDVRDVDGSSVVTVLVDLPSGSRVVGAAIATGGRPFTTGRAIDAALVDTRSTPPDPTPPA